MKVLHHGCAYPNYFKCPYCDCEFIYEDNETISILDKFYYGQKPLVWTRIACPECNQYTTLYNYKGKINKVIVYHSYDDSDYEEVNFDENTMERR